MHWCGVGTVSSRLCSNFCTWESSRVAATEWLIWWLNAQQCLFLF